MHPHSEVYPNAPLEFAAFEARFPIVRRIASSAAMDGLQNSLEAAFPIFEPLTLLPQPGSGLRERFLAVVQANADPGIGCLDIGKFTTNKSAMRGRGGGIEHPIIVQAF